MFETLFASYPIRQSLLTNLSPIQVARLLRAIGEDHSVGPQERAKYLNPMRNLFTDKELLKMQHDLAKMVDHHIVIWGNDLEEFLRGVPENLDHPDRYVKKLELWITQVSTQRAEARQPNIEIPGEWWTGWPHPCFGVAKNIQSRDTNNVRLHLHQADEVPNSANDFFWEANMWQLDKPFVRVPFHPSYFMSADRQQDLHYMTTKDMKTFHIKKVLEIASPGELWSQQWSQDRDLVLIHNFVFNPDQGFHPPGYFHPHPNGNFDDVESCVVEICRFILSLQDGSIDERSVRTFGS